MKGVGEKDHGDIQRTLITAIKNSTVNSRKIMVDLSLCALEIWIFFSLAPLGNMYILQLSSNIYHSLTLHYIVCMPWYQGSWQPLWAALCLWFSLVLMCFCGFLLLWHIIRPCAVEVYITVKQHTHFAHSWKIKRTALWDIAQSDCPLHS